MLRNRAIRFAAVSAALLVPVFWHQRIEAGDLASHTYNAWLAQLIAQGKAPGLWIAGQWNNVLFDWLLSGFGDAFGLHAAERIAVSLAVLIFFWGAFALLAAATRRAPWTLAPLLAAFAYGWTFEMGFLNYYLSLGLCFFVLAAFWRGAEDGSWAAEKASGPPPRARARDGKTRATADSRGVPVSGAADRSAENGLVPGPPAAVGQPVVAARWKKTLRIASLALLPLIWLAHPLGVACLAGVAAYALLAKLTPVGARRYLLLAGVAVLFGARELLARHYEVKYNSLARYFFYNGADQFVLFRWHYILLFAGLAILALLVLGDDAGNGRWREPGFWQQRAVPLQLYALALLAPLLLPNSVYLPGYNEPLTFLDSRLTSVSAILLCWAFAAAKPRRWHAGAYAAIAVVFFALLYADTGKLNRLEAQVEQAVAALPPGHRIVEDIDSGQEFRVIFEHIVDRACIGRCFSYTNYEPSSGQFRVRANPGNSIVTADPPNDLDDESEAAQVKALDPPVYEIVWCAASSASAAGPGASQKLCTRELTAAELNDLVQGNY